MWGLRQPNNQQPKQALAIKTLRWLNKFEYLATNLSIHIDTNLNRCMIHPSMNIGRAVLSLSVSERPACAREHKNIQDTDLDPILDISTSTSKGVGA